MYTNGKPIAGRRAIEGSGWSLAAVRLTRETMFLLALGLGASGIGIGLLCAAPASGASRALVRVDGEVVDASGYCVAHRVGVGGMGRSASADRGLS